jgi:aminoglycoside 6'-N-acetyltransferase
MAAAWRAVSRPVQCQARSVIELRVLVPGDLVLVEGWLREPHVSRWFLAGSSVEDEIGDLRASVGGAQPTRPLLVLDAGQPVGWCQWYRCADYPVWAADAGAAVGDIGIDYAIGDPGGVGRGLGTGLVGALVRHVRRQYPAGGIIAGPEAANIASRRVLEKNGFALLGERPLPSEPTPAPIAIYRLPAP